LKQESLQPLSENWQRRCGSYVRWQLVPQVGADDWEWPLADGAAANERCCQAASRSWSKSLCRLREHGWPFAVVPSSYFIKLPRPTQSGHPSWVGVMDKPIAMATAIEETAEICVIAGNWRWNGGSCTNFSA